jgi:hypothetical protein
MPQLFPPEIIQNITESLFVKRTVHSNIIYLVVIFSVVATIVSLPFIYVQVSAQNRGIIRAPDENNQLQTAIYGEVAEIRIAENTEVKMWRHPADTPFGKHSGANRKIPYANQGKQTVYRRY